MLLVAFLLVNALNCHLLLVLASVVQGDAVNCNICHLYFAFLVSPAAPTAIAAHLLLIRRCGLTFPLKVFLLALPPPTTPLGTASANDSAKPFGGLFGCCCTAVEFPSIGGRRCWSKLFTPFDRSFAFLLMKRPTKDCFVFLRDP